MLARYRLLPAPVLRFIAAEQLLTLVTVCLMMILNLHLRNLGHDDAAIASFTSYRFLAVLALAVPAGLWIRGRRLRPLLLAAAVAVPLATFAILVAASRGNDTALALAMAAWGVGMMALQVSNVPFVMRNATSDTQPEGIALSFATFSVAMVAVGLLVPALRRLGLGEAGVIAAIAGLGLGALPIVAGITEELPPAADRDRHRHRLGDHDWGRVAAVTIPNLFIAVGAGLTIPFINLFFNAVFGLDATRFAILGGATGGLVLVGSILNPAIRRRFGYRVAVTLSQGLAVGFLILLAMTERWAGVPGMVWVAAACFALRQPLMNMAGPITSELSMSYVGETSRELTAAVHASVWSGSWFLSAKLFQLFRTHHLAYGQIFLITAGLYAVGVVLWERVIRAHGRGLDGMDA